MKHNYLKVLLVVSLITLSIIPNFTFTYAAPTVEYPDSVTFKATIRDFKGLVYDKAQYEKNKKLKVTDGHLDFQNPDIFAASRARGYEETEGLVADELDEDNKPKLKKDKEGKIDTKGMITSEESFKQWYRDTDKVNKSIPYDLVLNHEGGGVYKYSSSEFFPINGDGFGNYTNGRNYHFTTEIQSKFVYHGGEEFKFEGDDDLWLFIDKKLVIDIGGVHEAVEKTVKLDDLGLIKGKIYSFSLFHAERQTTDSNFKIATSIAFYEEENYAMRVAAKTSSGEYTDDVTGYVGQIVEIEYRIPRQKIIFPEGTITPDEYITNFKAYISPGIKILKESKDPLYACPFQIKELGPDGGNKTMLTGTNIFDIIIEEGTTKGEYYIKGRSIKVLGRLLEPGEYEINSGDTTISYELKYYCDDLLGKKKGDFEVNSDTQIEVKPYAVEITGPDSIMLSQCATYTAKLSEAEISNPKFDWTYDHTFLEKIDEQMLDGVSTITFKGKKTTNITTLSVNVTSFGYEEYSESDDKEIEIYWGIDIQ